MTLVPPINVAEVRLAEAEGIVRSAAAAARPIAATLGPLTTFLPESQVLYLAVGPELATAAIEQLREAVFVEPLARALARPFVPHVTLVDGGEEGRLRSAAEALAGLLLDVTFDRLALLQEQRDEDGTRVWRPLVEARFGGPAVVARGGLEVELEVGERLAHDARAWFEAAWDDHDRALTGPGWAPAEPVTVTARRDGVVVGTATGACRDGEAHLERLIVDPSVRGEGVGGHLLAAFTSEAAGRGAGRVVLRAVAGGPAERFYLERGFTVAATLPRWRRGADFVLLERLLR
jgi:GNAT superfamily N-acetyltransferase